MWAYESVFYQIYPIGFCGAPRVNDGVLKNRIGKVADWAEHIAKLGCNAVYFSPLFESDSHGYDTRDFRKIDCRLGTNKDFAAVCETLHKNGVKVVLDGVFNHVGRGFWAFRDVQEKKWDSPYKDWFHISFDGNSNHYELVKLNLKNPAVVQHIFDCIRLWVEEFDIDGLRLDVAYCLDKDFIRQLRAFCDTVKPDFFLVGELLHGDYNQFVGDQLLHSCTNYECYKGLYSSMNSMNLFEITHSLLRQPAGLCGQPRRHPHRVHPAKPQAPAAGVRAAVRHAGHPLHLLRQRMGRRGRKASGRRRAAPVVRRASLERPDRMDRKARQGAPREQGAVLRRLQAAGADQQAVHLGAHL